jgi:host factor-I protein
MPPPDHTGDEARFLLEHKEKRTPMAVTLNDGEIVRGWIEYYDRDMVKINRTDGPNLFIRKLHIRYIAEDTQAG